MLVFEKAARAARSTVELKALFGQEIRHFGFSAYAVGYIPRSGPGTPDTGSDPFLLIDWPRSWLELYARQGFAQEDAVIAEAHRATAPFTWKELQARQPGASARIFAAARTFGWNDGLLVPVTGEGKAERVGVVSLAAPTLDDFDLTARNRIATVSVFAFRRAEELTGKQSPPLVLTPREQDVLILVARGYDDTEIGTELGLSKTTAHSYVERAKRRLGAVTRAQAVAQALTQGLLDLERMI